MKRNELFEAIIEDMKKQGMFDDLIGKIDELIEEAMKDAKIDILTIGLVPNGVTIGVHKGLMSLFTEEEAGEIIDKEIQDDIHDIGYKLHKKIDKKISKLRKNNELDQRIETLKKAEAMRRNKK